MNKRSSTRLYNRLMRQAIATGRAGTHTGRGNTASSDNALSFMGWANALADREEEADKVHSPTVGGGIRPMRIRGKSAEAEAPASNQPWREAGDPSMARSHPVLTLVSSRQRVARRNTSATPCLVLIMGGLSLDHDGIPGPTRR